MTRPTIGIFGALVALGGYLAVRYVQHKRAGQFPVARELSRWEGEGGAVAAPAAASGTLAENAGPSPRATDGAAQTNGDARAWPFPRS
jgi:hypothetical protein